MSPPPPKFLNGAAAGGLVIGLGGYSALAFVLPVFGLLGGFLVWRPGITRRAHAGSA